MKRTAASFAAVVTVAFVVVAVLAWQVARTHDLSKQNRALVERTASLGRQNAASIRRLQELQQQAIKACVSRHKIVLALSEVAAVNARRAKGSPSVVRNWQRLGIGIRSADCNAKQLRRAQQLIGPQEPQQVRKVQVVIRYRYRIRTRTRTRTLRVFVPVNHTVTVPGPATVRVETVTVTVAGETRTVPGPTRTVTVTVPGPPGKPTTTTTTEPARTVTKPKPCPPKNPHCP